MCANTVQLYALAFGRDDTCYTLFGVGAVDVDSPPTHSHPPRTSCCRAGALMETGERRARDKNSKRGRRVSKSMCERRVGREAERSAGGCRLNRARDGWRRP
jgi:hypothetical protein